MGVGLRYNKRWLAILKQILAAYRLILPGTALAYQRSSQWGCYSCGIVRGFTICHQSSGSIYNRTEPDARYCVGGWPPSPRWQTHRTHSFSSLISRLSPLRIMTRLRSHVTDRALKVPPNGRSSGFEGGGDGGPIACLESVSDDSSRAEWSLGIARLHFKKLFLGRFRAGYLEVHMHMPKEAASPRKAETCEAAHF